MRPYVPYKNNQKTAGKVLSRHKWDERPKTPKRHRDGGGAARGEGKRLCREGAGEN